MPPLSPTTRGADRARAHRTRALGALAASLLVVLAAVRLWPRTGGADPLAPPPTHETSDLLVLEEVERTSQVRAPEAAPPPPPEVLAPPVVVPDEVIVRELERPPVVAREAPAVVPAAPGIPDAAPGPPAPPPPPPTPEVVRDPDRAPFQVGPVLPVYPDAALREGIRARIRVEVLVDVRGRVLDARIVERIRLGRGDREEPVSTLPHGMDEAALAAARASRFRPARKDGQAVSSYATITLSFGV